ncbi:hypothetical protein FXO37_18117 [Capsicum annuum]|nr:hypothetical protein FXO37_18117 [Capsicum annuum]
MLASFHAITFRVRGMLTDFGDDMHCQFIEILRSLLDSYASGLQRSNFMEACDSDSEAQSYSEQELTGR